MSDQNVQSTALLCKHDMIEHKCRLSSGRGIVAVRTLFVAVWRTSHTDNAEHALSCSAING